MFVGDACQVGPLRCLILRRAFGNCSINGKMFELSRAELDLGDIEVGSGGKGVDRGVGGSIDGFSIRTITVSLGCLKFYFSVGQRQGSRCA